MRQSPTVSRCPFPFLSPPPPSPPWAHHQSRCTGVRCHLLLQVITGSHDKTVKLWDLRKGKAMTTLTHHKKSVRGLALHPTEYCFASASAENIKKFRLPRVSAPSPFPTPYQSPLCCHACSDSQPHVGPLGYHDSLEKKRVRDITSIHWAMLAAYSIHAKEGIEAAEIGAALPCFLKQHLHPCCNTACCCFCLASVAMLVFCTSTCSLPATTVSLEKLS